MEPEKKADEPTSSSARIGLIAMTCIIGPWLAFPLPSPLPFGNTTTAFGKQLWFIRATLGTIASPSGARVGEESVRVLVVN